MYVIKSVIHYRKTILTLGFRKTKRNKHNFTLRRVIWCNECCYRQSSLYWSYQYYNFRSWHRSLLHFRLINTQRMVQNFFSRYIFSNDDKLHNNIMTNDSDNEIYPSSVANWAKLHKQHFAHNWLFHLIFYQICLYFLALKRCF